MHAKTIEYLLNQKVCICGTHLDEGSVPYTKVKALIDFLPPQSISNMISDFKKEAKRRANAQQDLFSHISDNLAVISQQDEEVTDLQDELHTIEWKLSVEIWRAKSGNQHEIQLCDKVIRESEPKRPYPFRKRL